MIIHFNFARLVSFVAAEKFGCLAFSSFMLIVCVMSCVLHLVLFIVARAFVWCRCADTFPFVVWIEPFDWPFAFSLALWPLRAFATPLGPS